VNYEHQRMHEKTWRLRYHILVRIVTLICYDIYLLCWI
jgi:hypothetical protein